jgi:hypothetical protein
MSDREPALDIVANVLSAIERIEDSDHLLQHRLGQRQGDHKLPLLAAPLLPSSNKSFRSSPVGIFSLLPFACSTASLFS